MAPEGVTGACLAQRQCRVPGAGTTAKATATIGTHAEQNDRIACVRPAQSAPGTPHLEITVEAARTPFRKGSTMPFFERRKNRDSPS